MTKDGREYKQLPFYVQKVDSDLGVVDAIVAVMGNVDHQRDIIDNGAFKKTIQERGKKIRVLDNHNTGSVKDVVGMPIFFSELSRDSLPQGLLKEHPDATGGLFASIQFLMDTPEGKGVFSRIKSGAVSEYSIGYDALDTIMDTATDKEGKEINVRRLKTIRLWEISPVIFAANDATLTVGAKAEDDNIVSIDNGAAMVVSDNVEDSTDNSVGLGYSENITDFEIVISDSSAPVAEAEKAKKPDKDETDKDEKEPTEGKPYGIFSEDGEHCIFKIDEDGNQVGDSLGCHATRQEAADQVRALFAADEESSKESHTDDDKKPLKKPKQDDVEPNEKTVSGKTTFLLAGRDVAWDSNKADQRVREFTSSENEPSTSYKDGFFWYDAENSDTFGAYKLGFTDIIDGKRIAIPRGIFAVANSLQGGRGEKPDIPESDVNGIKTKVEKYYSKMDLEAPWVKSLMIENLVKQFIAKEMTDYGPQQRFGDVLQGNVHKVYNNIVDKYYIEGYINREQRILLSNAIGKALDILSMNIPDDIAHILVYYYDCDGHMSDDKELESKAGRVLARRNEHRIVNAILMMIEVMDDAGISIPGFGEDDITEDETMTNEKTDTLDVQAVSEEIAPEKAAKQQGVEEAGPETPTFDRDKLLQLINIYELELLED